MCRTPKERLDLLFSAADDFHIIQSIDINYYNRFIRSMLRLSAQHSEEGQKEKAYILSVRIVLCIQKLPSHKDYDRLDPHIKKELKSLQRLVLESAELAKEELKSKFQNEYELYCKTLESTSNKENKQLYDTSIPHDNNIQSGTINSSTSNELVAPSTEHNNEPVFDRSLKPVVPKILVYGFTKVYLSRQLIDDFLRLAERNTRENRETCGTLCGKLLNGNFRITNLLIPKQSGTSDSCVTCNEEEIFTYLDSRQLITLGWIHTHPTQTAFLSAVDLHCQLSYQAMLPEAIAIVCAPKFSDIKCFSLTPDHGISFLSKCKRTGFHPHDTTLPLYEPSKHVIFDNSIEHFAEDLR